MTAVNALTVVVRCGFGGTLYAGRYGVGLSEARFGIALHRLPRSSFHVQTKVGRFLVPDPDGANGTKVGWIGGSAPPPDPMGAIPASLSSGPQFREPPQNR